MNIFKPSTWRKPKTGVYVRITLDKHFQGITEAEPSPREMPWVKVNGLSLAEASMQIPGKSINWHIVPMYIREKLEMDPWHLEIEWVELRKWVI